MLTSWEAFTIVRINKILLVMHHGDRSILQKASSLTMLLSSESLETKRRKLLLLTPSEIPVLNSILSKEFPDLLEELNVSV